jgi:hypothetical protein
MTTFKTDLVVHKELLIRIPDEIGDICDAIQDKYKNEEFSIVCKGEWKSKGFTLSQSDWAVPIQRISGSSVDYDSENLLELKQQGYTCVIHSHPFNMKSFSSRDMDTICTHFPASVLYCGDEFTDATMAVLIAPGHTYQAQVEVEAIHYSNTTLPEDSLKNITKHHVVPKEEKKKTVEYSPNYGKGSVYRNPKYNGGLYDQYSLTNDQWFKLTDQNPLPDVLDIATPTEEVLGRLRTDIVEMVNSSFEEPDLLEEGCCFRGSSNTNGGVRNGTGMFVRGRYFEVPKQYRSLPDNLGKCNLVEITPEESKLLTEKFIERHHKNVAALKNSGAIP